MFMMTGKPQAKPYSLLTKCSQGERISGYAELLSQVLVVCPEIILSSGKVALKKKPSCQLTGLLFFACLLD